LEISGPESRANFPKAGILLPLTGIVLRANQGTIVFCGSKKSLSQGITKAKVIFASHAVGAAVLPLMLFDQIQLMVCAALAQRWGPRAEPSPSLASGGAKSLCHTDQGFRLYRGLAAASLSRWQCGSYWHRRDIATDTKVVWLSYRQSRPVQLLLRNRFLDERAIIGHAA
jgi:SBF-like CPA transporter family (DUF4137)